MISKYKTHLEDLKSLYHRRLGAKEELEQNIDKTNAQIQTLESISGQSILALELLSQVSKVAREKAKTHLESIVTEALVYILGNDYKFVIDLGESGGKPTCEFYVETTVNGEVSRQKPEQACGGGVVDIISTALRYAYLEIFNDDVVKATQTTTNFAGWRFRLAEKWSRNKPVRSLQILFAILVRPLINKPS